ncbi:uncharacterized protein ABDE67_014264 [Symphorus nematophorus]
MSSRLAFQTQLASIMEVLANAAVAEICKLVDDDYAVVSLQMSQCQRENKALKRKLHLLELKMARGNAERRLRESAMNSNRPRIQINTGGGSDRLRESSPSTDGVFERQMDVSLWSGRAPAGDTTSELIHSDSIQSKSPDVELVEPEPMLVKEETMEANMPRVVETEEDVPLIGDDGVVECGAAGQRPSVEQQDTQSSSQSQTQAQIQSSRTRRTGSGSSRGVEKEEEEPDVVLVKVEEVEPATGTQSQTGLSIQEGLVESSTDDYRAVLPFEESTQTSSQLSDLQESGRGFSEVSYGRSSLWNNGGGSYCHDDSLPGPSSHCAPLSFLPSTLIGAEPGSSGRGLAAENSAGRGLAVESSRGFHTSVSLEQQPPVIDLSEDPSPVQVLGQIQGPRRFLGPGQSQGQGSHGSAGLQHKIPRKKVCICRFCSKAFISPASLESHLRTHTGERPYGCSICGKKFSQFWNMKIHKNIHTGERPYQCSLCPDRFSDPSNLKKHQKRHHPQTSGPSAAAQSNPVTSPEPGSIVTVQLRVPDTNTPASPGAHQQRSSLSSEYSLFELETFFTRWAPDSDSASAPGGPSCSFPTDDSEECDQDGVIIVESEPQHVLPPPQSSASSAGRMGGGQSFSSTSDRSRAHIQPSVSQGTSVSIPLRMQAPSSQPPWSRTSAMIRSAQLLQQQHRNDSRISQQQQQQQQQQQLSLPSVQTTAAVSNTDGTEKTSISGISSTSRTLSSTLAPQSALPTAALASIEAALAAQRQASLLARHNKSQAAGIVAGERRRKSYVCRACGKAFSGLSNLEAHERVHTGEKPFRCDTCGKRFSEAGNLKKHQRVHTGEKPFSCEQCGKRFAWICNLRTHQQSATGCGPQARGGSGLG